MSELNPQLKIAASYAINTAVERFRKKSFSLTDLELNVCKACLNGLNRIDSAEDIHRSYVENNTSIDNLVGLSNGSTFETYETAIKTDYLSAYSTNVKTVYSVVTACMALGSYAAGLNYSLFTGFLYKGYEHLNSALGSGPVNGFYSAAQISTITGYNYSGVLATIYNSSPRSKEAEKSYFRYYDFTDSFSSDINLVKSRDVSIQTYSVSGELNYSPKPWDSLPICEYIEIPVYPTSDPTVVGRYFYGTPVSLPCIDKERNIAPITGQEFYRKFNDGPYSSGEWSESVIANSFHSRDTGYHHRNSNRDNALNLYSYDGIGMGGLGPVGTVIVDTPQGEMVPVYPREVAQQPLGGRVIEQHVGNYESGRVGYSLSGYARGEEIPSAYEVYNIVTGHTGLKIVPMRLKESCWRGTMSSIASNPLLESGRIYVSALNFVPSHITDFSATSGIAGPPQRDYSSDFPYVVVEQNYQSETAGRYAGLRIRLGISASEIVEGNKGTLLGIETGFSNSFEDANYYQPDENNQAEVIFNYGISSTDINDTGNNTSIIRSFALGMGNGMDGTTLYPYIINNNGYIHSGYLFSGGRIPFGTGDSLTLGNYTIARGYAETGTYAWGNSVFDGYGSYSTSGGIFGAPQVEDLMLMGWAHDDFGEIPISPMYAYNNLDEYLYSGFDSGMSLTIAAAQYFPPVGAQDGFAKNPYSSGLLGSGWYPVIRKQKRENSFPRYFRGPFATAKKRFLYPAAELMQMSANYLPDDGGLDTVANKGSQIFVNRFGEDVVIGEYPNSGLSARVGFPHRVVFDLNIKQYAKRELFRYDRYDAFSGLSENNYPGVNPSIMSFGEVNTFSPTHAVDEDFGQHDGVAGDKVVMPDETKNPCIYDSPPNYVQGFLSDEVGVYSGAGNPALADWAFKQSGAYIVNWGYINGYGPGGPSYSDTGRKNPVGNFSRYTGYTVKITGYYVPPGYRLETSQYNPEPVYRAFPPSRMFFEENSPRTYGQAGADPLYFNRIGSFTGVTQNYWPDEILNGGQHPTGPSGLVGDSWIGFNSGHRDVAGTEYGYGHYWINDTLYGLNRHRDPSRDNRVVIADIKPSGLGFYFAALEYFPGVSNTRKTYSNFSDETGYFKSGFYKAMDGEAFSHVGKIFSYTGAMESGRLYQIPSGSDWVPVGGQQPSATGWQQSHTGTIFHWRQGCKIELSISSISWSGYGDSPYDVEHLVMPSGSCSIDGAMKYEHLSEKPVYSEGMFLTDVTVGDVVKSRSFYPQFLSPVMKEHGYTVVVPANSEVQDAPSKQVEAAEDNLRYLYQSSYVDINTIEKNYNKFIVGAISDYAYLNASVMPSYDGKPLADGSMMPNTTMLYSACQGQEFPDGTVNPSISKKYEVSIQRQYHDAELTIATGDGRFFGNSVPVWEYIQPDNGALFPNGITWTEYKKGLY